MLKLEDVIKKSFYSGILEGEHETKFGEWYEENSEQLSYRWLSENDLHPFAILENVNQIRFSTWVIIEYTKTDMDILRV